jgi:signal transduction histidine kinase
MTFYAVSALVNAITSAILGFFVISKKRSKSNLYFFLFSLSVSLWSLSYFLWQIANNSHAAVFWLKMLTICSVFIPVFYYKFTIIFLDLSGRLINMIVSGVGFFLVAIFIIISPTDLLVEDVVPKLSFRYWPNAGDAYWFFISMFATFAVYSMILLAKAYLRKKSGIKKEQIKFLLLGTGLGFLGGATNFPLWYDISIVPFGNILVSLYVIFSAYAILKYHLLDIKILTTQLFSLVILVISFIQVVNSKISSELFVNGLIFVALTVFTGLLVYGVEKDDKRKQELQKMTNRMAVANEELKKLDAAKSEFLNIASHQLRTPVSVIRGVASMLVAGDMEKLPLEEKKKFYNSILAKSNKLEVIIHDILNATSLSAKKFSVMDKDAEMIDLAKLIKDVLRDFEMEIGERELEVTFEEGKNVPKISGQKEYLKEAFTNLLTNAIKYTPTSKKTNDIRDTREGKGFLKIRIEADPAEKNKVLVVFEDNGIGISQEDAPKLFKRFSRAQNAKNMYTDGTGIGLFVVREIIEGHNGKVWFESELGKGTTFFVSLPIVSAKKINVKEHIIKKQQASLPA